MVGTTFQTLLTIPNTTNMLENVIQITNLPTPVVKQYQVKRTIKDQIY